MKKYFENPMLQIVGINKKDIIVTSDTRGISEEKVNPSSAEAPGLRGIFDPYDPYNAEY